MNSSAGTALTRPSHDAMLVTETSISLPRPLISQEKSLACELFLISSLIAKKGGFTSEGNSVACELFLISTRMPEGGEICLSYLHSSLTNYDYTNSFLLSAKSNAPVVIFVLQVPFLPNATTLEQATTDFSYPIRLLQNNEASLQSESRVEILRNCKKTSVAFHREK
jgi:hypothetical protein